MQLAALLLLAQMFAPLGCIPGLPVRRPVASEDITICLPSRDCLWVGPYIMPGILRDHPGCVLIVVRCEYEGGDEDGCDRREILMPDRDGPTDEWSIRAEAERLYPGREIVFVLVVPPDAEGPDPERM